MSARKNPEVGTKIQGVGIFLKKRFPDNVYLFDQSLAGAASGNRGETPPESNPTATDSLISLEAISYLSGISFTDRKEIGKRYEIDRKPFYLIKKKQVYGKAKNNMVMRNTRGMVGKQIVFKRKAGKSYVAAPPEVNEYRKPTARQLQVQERLKACSIYAKKAIQSPDLKKQYQAAPRREQSASNVAFLDANNVPRALGIITQGYEGQAGNLIVVAATDDF